ncbi:MAG: histidine kinase dimerization/phospho-acceptor domain-containing protein, partial [Chloroflexota bacterium]
MKQAFFKFLGIEKEDREAFLLLNDDNPLHHVDNSSPIVDLKHTINRKSMNLVLLIAAGGAIFINGFSLLMGEISVFTVVGVYVGIMLFLTFLASRKGFVRLVAFLLIINIYGSAIIPAVALNDTGGFFIHALSILLLVASLILNRTQYYITAGLAFVFILFQFLGGPEWLLGEFGEGYTNMQLLVFSLSWLVMFVAISRAGATVFQGLISKVGQLNRDLELTQASLIESNSALDQANSSLERRVRERTLALETALKSAEEANVAKDRFFAMMSHELRTPLNAILGYSEYIPDIVTEFDAQHLSVEDLSSMEEIEAMSQRINVSGKKLLGLIDYVLQISKLQAGQVSLTLAPVPLAELCKVLESSLASELEKNHNKLIIFNRYDRKNIVTDRQKLHQILDNLLSNAVKFTQSGRIELHIDADPEFDNHVVFEIKDS